MPVDPRLGSLAISIDPIAKVTQELADLRRRLDSLERAANVQVGAGAPTVAARDGTLYIDTTNSRLYARSAGAWKYAALT